MSIAGVIAVFIILCIACWEDLKFYRIRNPVIAAGWFYGVLNSLFQSGLIGIVRWGIASMFPIVLLFFLFLIKGLGAGDIKLFSVISGILGIRFIIQLIIASFLMGAVFSVFRMIQFRIFLYRLNVLFQYIHIAITEKKIRRYYDSKTDGKQCIIPFTTAVLSAFVILILKLYILKL